MRTSEPRSLPRTRSKPVNDQATATAVETPVTPAPKAKITAKLKAKLAPKKATKPDVKLNKPQLRILGAVAKAPENGFTSAQIAVKAKVAASWVTGYTFKACKANTSPSLTEQGLVKENTIDVHGDGKQVERRATITAAGRKVLEKSKSA